MSAAAQDTSDVHGKGLPALGVVLMLVCRFRDPAFFRGQTLHRDTPALIVPE